MGVKRLVSGGQRAKKVNRETLTSPFPMEYKVLKLVGEGLTNQTIADCLHIKLNTVKSHMRRLFLKLRVVDRKSLIEVARRKGLLDQCSRLT